MKKKTVVKEVQYWCKICGDHFSTIYGKGPDDGMDFAKIYTEKCDKCKEK